MYKQLAVATLLLSSTSAFSAQDTLVNGLDIGPLAKLVGKWQTAGVGGVDIAPGQEGSQVGKGAKAVEPLYETIEFEVAADATNASQQYLTAVYYKQEVFRKRDDQKFHDQRGYLIYDKEAQMVYNSFCIPRAVCIVTEAKAGDILEFKTPSHGIAQTQFMSKNDSVTDFQMRIDMSKADKLIYSQTTSLDVYGKPFSHIDSSVLERVK